MNWCQIQVKWDSSDLVVNWFEIQMISVVNWFEIQLIWLSIDLRFKWFGCQPMCDSIDFVCQLISDSSELVVNWSEIQMSWLSIDLRFKWDFLQNWSCEAQKRSFSARLPSKLKLWSSKTKHFCETSFKIEAVKLKNEAFLRDFLQNEALKLKNEAFLRDFLQKWSFAAPKRSISARLPSKMKLWSSKNEAFLRDFLQKWHVDRTLDLRITIRISDFQLDASKVLRLPRKSCAEAHDELL